MVKTTTKPKGTTSYKRFSTKISSTSYKETAFGIIPRSKLVKLELEGTKKGLDYIYKLTAKETVSRVSPGIICKLHEICFGWIFPKWAGKYRTIQVMFSGKEAPPYFQVPELIVNLSNDLKERLKHLSKPDNEHFILEVVELLAWFQHRFVFIHPFQDYNGRTARILTTFILLQLNLPPIELKAETGTDRKRYLKAMQEADEGDFTLLETLINNALSESLEQIKKNKFLLE